MAVSLFVGNLPYSVSEETLSDLFSQAGTVVGVRLPTERETGRPRGFGFVEMESNEDAQNAIRQFDGYRLDNREIRVNVAEERAPRAARSDRGRY
ncbi:MAG: RNA recognition motif domain-containing protein [Dehalococcoidia bacterium]|jgi:cold-inducible RNA-binding protein